MKKMNLFHRHFMVMPLLLVLSGCATTSMFDQPEHNNKPLIMSGSRLNIASLSNQPYINEIFGVNPPTYPLLDLPFSALLDVVLLGYTVPVALMSSLLN